jgi:hypothetical protein
MDFLETEFSYNHLEYKLCPSQRSGSVMRDSLRIFKVVYIARDFDLAGDLWDDLVVISTKYNVERSLVASAFQCVDIASSTRINFTLSI